LNKISSNAKIVLINKYYAKEGQDRPSLDLQGCKLHMDRNWIVLFALIVITIEFGKSF